MSSRMINLEFLSRITNEEKIMIFLSRVNCSRRIYWGFLGVINLRSKHERRLF